MDQRTGRRAIDPILRKLVVEARRIESALGHRELTVRGGECLDVVDQLLSFRRSGRGTGLLKRDRLLTEGLRVSDELLHELGLHLRPVKWRRRC